MTENKSKLQLEYKPVNFLKEYPGNPRKHPDLAIDKLVKSIENFGWTNPILTDKDGMVLAGHARLKAAKKSGLKEVPVIRLPLSGKEAELYVIADNKLQDYTEWDFPKLADIFQELDAGDIDLEISGFDMAEIEGLINGLDSSNFNEASIENKNKFEIVVSFSDEAKLQAAYDRFISEGYECRVLIY